MNRDELVERVALDAVNRIRAKWGIEPINSMARISPEEQQEYRSLARAALAIIEPAVREECARVCDARYMGDNNREDQEARRCAAAIRAGDKP